MTPSWLFPVIFVFLLGILPFWIFICANLRHDKMVYGRDSPFSDWRRDRFDPFEEGDHR